MHSVEASQCYASWGEPGLGGGAVDHKEHGQAGRPAWPMAEILAPRRTPSPRELETVRRRGEADARARRMHGATLVLLFMLRQEERTEPVYDELASCVSPPLLVWRQGTRGRGVSVVRGLQRRLQFLSEPYKQSQA